MSTAESFDEGWLTSYSPVVVGGSAHRVHRLALGEMELLFPASSSERWNPLVLYRGDGARTEPRLTPASLAKYAPRRLGDTRGVLCDLFCALVSAEQGCEVRIDQRGVVQSFTCAESAPGAWLVRTHAWATWWWPLLDWLAGGGGK